MQKHADFNRALSLSTAALALCNGVSVIAQTPQENVHNMSHSVIPAALGRFATCTPGDGNDAVKCIGPGCSNELDPQPCDVTDVGDR